MNLLLEPLLDRPDLLPPYCVVCGKPANNAHHVIVGMRKSLRVPRLRLCGSGTTGCHGLAHERRLHFRFRDGWEWLATDEPTKYQAAIEMDGWRAL